MFQSVQRVGLNGWQCLEEIHNNCIKSSGICAVWPRLAHVYLLLSVQLPCLSVPMVDLHIFCLFIYFSRGGPLAVYFVAATGMACRVQCCLRCIHQLTTGVQRVLQPEETMGTLYTGQYTGPSAQVTDIYYYRYVTTTALWKAHCIQIHCFVLDLNCSGGETVKRNSSISRLYILYQMFTVGSSILGPASVTLMVAGRFWSGLCLFYQPFVIGNQSTETWHGKKTHVSRCSVGTVYDAAWRTYTRGVCVNAG